jgi:short-subunit dehydrogenase
MRIEELFSVRGKTALITGGSRGIGEMIARAYVENGAKVYITARKADACDALAKELSKFGECISIPADISRIEEIDRLGSEIEKRESISTYSSTMPAPAGVPISQAFRNPDGTR